MKKYIIASVLLLTTACAGSFGPARHSGMVRPENLVSATKEKASFSLKDAHSLEELTDWVSNDQPAHAELSCAKADLTCQKAARILQSFNVPFHHGHFSGKNPSVTLSYHNIVARDCAKITPAKDAKANYDTNPPMGCSVATNIVKMLGSYNQIVSPAVSGLHDAESAIRGISSSVE